MDADLLKNVGMVAGIGGVALAVLMTVFREVIRKNIFAQLDSQAGYRLLRLMLLLTWSVAIIGVAAWFFAKQADGHAALGTPTKEFTLVGLITDAQENSIAEANVSVVGNGSFVRSDSSGSFNVTPLLGAERDVIVRITKDGYRPKTVQVTLPRQNLIVTLERATSGDVPAPLAGADIPPVTLPSQPATSTDTSAGLQAGLRSVLTRWAANSTTPNAASPGDDLASDTRNGTISIRYLGDPVGCVLNLGMRIGSREFAPTTNPFAVTDIALGRTQYAVSGGVTCPSVNGPVSCIANGTGTLTLHDGGIYNVVWQNTAFGQCQVGLTPAN